MKIESDTEMPPGGWKLTVPATGILVHASYARSLFKRVNDHLGANGLERMDRETFEHLACKESGHGLPWCTGGPAPVKTPTTMHAIRQFLRTMVTLVKKRKLVSKEEHARRMKICEACPKNSVEGLGCHNCIDDLREVEKEVGKMPAGNVLTCTACGGCVCWAKTWIDNEVLDEAEASAMPDYHELCWRRGG